MNVVIVDDHPLVRQGLKSILSIEKDIEVVGEAANIPHACEMIEKNAPDIVIVDLMLGNNCGLDLIKKFKQMNYDIKFIILTSSADLEAFKQAEKLGVDGYVLKDALPEEFLYAIHLVEKGRKHYDPVILDNVISSHFQDPIQELTARERDVLLTLGKGLKNNEIARELNITEYTVKKHVSNILDKLRLSDRTQAALFAHEKGLVASYSGMVD